MIKEAIAQLVKRNDLTAETMGEVMEEIMTNQATDAQKASFLTALAMKREKQLMKSRQQQRLCAHIVNAF